MGDRLKTKPSGLGSKLAVGPDPMPLIPEIGIEHMGMLSARFREGPEVLPAGTRVWGEGVISFSPATIAQSFQLVALGGQAASLLPRIEACKFHRGLELHAGSFG